MAGRTLALVYGVLCYAFFIGTFLYAIGFVGNWVVPRSIDTGTPGGTLPSVVINVALLGLFAVQHTIMARPAFKRWWTAKIPAPAERSTFVFATCIVLALVFWQWRPMPMAVWHTDNTVAVWALSGLSLFGYLIVLYSSFLVDHFDLFGLRQVVLQYRGCDYTYHPFAERSLYKLVRHPLMLGFLLAFWATPSMSQGHLLFAIATSVYILFGISVEERDLLNFLGDDYKAYRKRTPALIPFLPKGKVG
jgi:protein-S-isoprenylcysteine O-methyltransferase Ste14